MWRMSVLVRMIEPSFGNQVYGTDGCLHQCSLDRDDVCCDTIDEVLGCPWIDLDGEQIPANKSCFGSLRLMGM